MFTNEELGSLAALVYKFLCNECYDDDQQYYGDLLAKINREKAVMTKGAMYLDADYSGLTSSNFTGKTKIL